MYASTGLREAPAELARRWEEGVRERLAARAAARWQALRLGDSVALLALLPPRQALVPLLAAEPEQGAARGVSVLGQYADLGIQLDAVIDIRFDRLKNLRCTPGDVTSFSIGCRETFNPPRIEPQFNVRSGGVVGQRVHLNVDYDTQREFDASNNIQVYYQGLEDEILRRVEVGNVTFSAPRSRFITGGIPSNNFGVAASGQLGALDFGMIFAQQKGNVVRERVFTVGEATVQPVDRQLADRDFEPQRFFMVRNPRALPGYPNVDILNLGFSDLPDSLRVADVRIYRYRSSVNRPPTETNIAGIPAVAIRDDSPERAGPVNWEPLAEGRDYYLDPSGQWFALTQRVDQQDFLAVSYITGRGDTVGTFPAAAAPGRTDTLELIYLPQVGPASPLFYYELRNAYRIGSTDDITRSSVGVELRVGGSQRPAAGAPTFLALLGLAQETDASTFDHYNRLFPRSRDPNGGLPLREFYVVFPSLTPFADSTRLPPEYRTDSLYRTPVYRLRTEGPAPLFQVSLHYDARGGDSRGNLALGGFQIRLGSERVMVAGRPLNRNVDYTINYEIGQITFLRPDSLFPRATQVTVQFEENAAFAVAPTTILGLQSRYDLGEHGSLSAVALTQRQRSTFTRPPLGFEPASNLVASVSGNFQFRPMRLTRLLDALPLVTTEAPSLLTLDAELATSRPSPNQLGVAYVETFEGEGGLFIPLSEGQWEFGSRPSSSHGLATAGIGPAGFVDDDAVPLTWQNLIPAATGSTAFQLRPVDIDSTIRTQGTGQQAETVLWSAFHPDTLGGIVNPLTQAHRWLLPHTPGPRWRSIAQPLSATGLDLTRVEYLEFWVLEDETRTMRNEGVHLVFDFGTVYEDAVAFQPTSFTVGADTVFSGRRRAGEGRLDTERDTLSGAFNASQHDNGVLGDVADSILNADNNTVVTGMPLCQSELGQRLLVIFWGNFLQHCTRRNGQLDSEDLNNDQHLDTLVAATGESHVRFVVPIGDPRYEVRAGGWLDTLARTHRWRLYRVPFRSDTLQVGVPDLRQVRALRLTVTAPQTAEPESTMFFALARMRLVGAPWVKRASSPIAGLAGNRGEPHGEVVASVVSTENFDDLGYTPPPGVTDEGQTIGGGQQIGSTQINERSLRLVSVDVRAGERAEAYYRFPEGERNFLGYREMRLWARGRGTGWETQDLRFFVKVGQNEDNFYLFRAPIRSVDWLPEVVVNFDRWSALRAEVERAFLSGAPPSGAAACGGDTLAYVACDGPYLVHMRNPAVAPPNLTRVQELAVGFVRDSGLALDSAELWIDDIRLSSVVNTPGYAASVNMTLTAGDVADVVFGVSRRDGNFRQLGENPAYVGTNTMTMYSTVRLERFGLERLGIAAPLTIQLDRSSEDPFYLAGTDVRAEGLTGLRSPRLSSSSYSLSVRRVRRGTRWWERYLVDNVGVAATWGGGDQRTSLSSSTSRLSSLRGDYQLSPPEVSLRYVPGFVRGVLEDLPPFLRNSDLVRGLREGRLRFTPIMLAVAAGVTRTNARRESFRVPIVAAFDTIAPIVSTTAVLRNSATVEMRPFGSMSLGVTANWDRDLKDYGDSTTIARVAAQSRERLLGMDVGFVRQRDLTARFNWAPPAASWLRPRIGWNSNFALSRDPNSQTPERADGDSAGAFRLPTVFSNGASFDVGTSVDLSRMLRGIFGDSSGLRKALDRVTQLDIGRRVDHRSQFDRAGFDPGLGYQLGFDGRGGEALDGRVANAAYRLGQDRINVSVRAPLGFTVTGVYSEREATTWFLRPGGTQEQRLTEREWPNVQARWSYNPRPAWLRRFVTTVSAGAGLIRRSATSDYLTVDASGALRFEQTSRAAPLNVSIGWAPGINTTWSHSNDESVSDRSGNLTRSDRGTDAVDVTFTFRPPREVVPLPSDVRASLRWMGSASTICLERVAVPGCSAVADSRRSDYNLTMDTHLPPNVTAGLSVGYVLSEDRHVNRKFSQFTLTLTGRVSFAAGELR